MTLEEALKVASVASRCDGGCSVCMETMTDLLNETFPEFEWVYNHEADDWVSRIGVRVVDAG